MAETTPQYWGVPFHEHAQIEILPAPAGHGRARIPALQALTNHTGAVHGAMLYAVGEVAAAAGVVALLGEDTRRYRGVTRGGSIAYLKPGRGEITGESVVGMSRQDMLAALETAQSVDVPISVTLTDAEGVNVATLAITWFLGRPRAAQSANGAAG